MEVQKNVPNLVRLYYPQPELVDGAKTSSEKIIGSMTWINKIRGKLKAAPAAPEPGFLDCKLDESRDT